MAKHTGKHVVGMDDRGNVRWSPDPRRELTDKEAAQFVAYQMTGRITRESSNIYHHGADTLVLHKLHTWWVVESIGGRAPGRSFYLVKRGALEHCLRDDSDQETKLRFGR